jgi:hypothetical protein
MKKHSNRLINGGEEVEGECEVSIELFTPDYKI